MGDGAAVEQRMRRIEQLVQEIEQSSDPAAQSAAREMVRTVLDLHTEGLARMVDLLSARGEFGRATLESWADDELIAGLLLLHGLHPRNLESRVGEALDEVRGYLRSHGGDVELLGVADGRVRLRMHGSCDGCPSSRETLQHTIEQAIYWAAPDVAAIEVEGLSQEPASPLVQLRMT